MVESASAGSGPVTVREATFRLLESLGIDKVFGNPGSTELPMFRDFPSRFSYVLGLQESVVIGMADGIVSVFFRPTLASILATLLVAFVLVLRPQGLFGTAPK
mgnify:CR=1 FL=1